MAETKNPDAPLVAPRAARHEHGQTGIGRIGQFLSNVRAEMKRVSWPTFTHVKNTTIITIIAVIFFGVYLFLVDQALSRVVLGLDWLLERIARFLGLA